MYLENILLSKNGIYGADFKKTQHTPNTYFHTFPRLNNNFSKLWHFGTKTLIGIILYKLRIKLTQSPTNIL